MFERFGGISTIVRGLFLVLFALRLGTTLHAQLPAITSGRFSLDVWFHQWLVVRFAFDALFLALTALAFERFWVPPLMLFWLGASFYSSVGEFQQISEQASFITLQGAIVLLVGGAVFMKLFSWSGIRGRMMIICLISAGFPLFYMVLAIEQQNRLLEEHAFFPIARGMISTEIIRLNRMLSQRLNQQLQRLIKLPDEKSSPTISVSDYQKRAQELGFELIDVRSFGRISTDSLSLDMRDIALDQLLGMLARRFEFSLEIRCSTPEKRRISIRADKASLQQVLDSLAKNHQLTFTWDHSTLVVGGAEITATQTSQISLMGNKSDSSQDARIFFDLAAAGSDTMSLMIQTGRGSETMVLRVIDSTAPLLGTVLEINLKHLLRKHLKDILALESWSIQCVFPATLDSIQEAFPKSQRLRPNFSLTELKLSAIDFDNRGSAFSWRVSRSGGNFVDPQAWPYAEDFQALRELMIATPDHRHLVLESWFLPSLQVRMIVALNAHKVWHILFHERGRVYFYVLLAVVFAGFLALIYSDRLSRPIRDITESARAIRDGNLETRIPPQEGHAEIDDLAATLDVMAQQLKGRLNLANQKLMLEKSRFETLVESTWEGIFLLSQQGTLLYANPAGRQLIDNARPEASFWETLQGIGQEFAPSLPEAWSPDFHEFKTVFQVSGAAVGNHRIFALYIRACRQEGAHSEPQVESGFVAVLRDITVEKEIDRMKTDFVSQVSHELRTPLTSIEAYTEMLLDDEAQDPASRREYLQIIYDEAERLTRLINDLLDIARIESGRRALKLGDTDLNKISRNIVHVLAGQIEKKHQTVTLELPDEACVILGDEDLLKQAGLNILSNASKYSPAGATLRVGVMLRADERIAWVFQDSGIGLTPKDRDRLFTKFFRADSDYVRAVGGTGLGLTLVKNIIDAHRGEIQVDSVFQQGSTFTLLLPRK
jgi:signal transduction histidine kinase